MAVKNAEKFIREIIGNSDLRKSLYPFEETEEKLKFISESGFDFEIPEFEESINYLKTICADEEEAIMLDELLLWWQIMMPYDIYEESSTQCTPDQCRTCSSCN
jgi:predicted ribosomally synthesized peptide with nif11-like leader